MLDQIAFTIENSLLNMSHTVRWQDRWWLALALFGKLAVEYDVHDTSQLVQLFELEE